MSAKSKYDSVQRTLNRCMNKLKQIRVDELDDIFEERDEFIRLSNLSKEVCENLEKSLDEAQKELFRQFIDYNVGMYADKSIFYYIHGFEDCQRLYQLFRELSEGKESLPQSDENEKFDDLTSYDNDIENLIKSQSEYECKEIEYILEISQKLDNLLIKYYGKRKEN